VLPIIDARRKRLYCALYANGRRISDYLDISIEAAADLVESHISDQRKSSAGSNSSARAPSCLVTGVSNSTVADFVEKNPGFVMDPCCERGRGNAYIKLGLAMLADGITDDDDAGPLYLRMSDAEEKRADLSENAG
jgi:hypothetical protein